MPKQKAAMLKGLGVSPGIATGVVRLASHGKLPRAFREGDVLVTRITDPAMVTLMARASAIVCDIGGLTSHPSIVSREMGIPCVVATKTATKTLLTGQRVQVDGGRGMVTVLP